MALLQLNIAAIHHFIEQRKYTFPRDHVEFTLKKIWQDALHITEIDIQEKFYSIGGYSMIAVHLISKINKTFSTNLPVPWLLKYNTIKLQAQFLRNTDDIKKIF